MQKLFDVAPVDRPDQMAERRPMHFKASDGTGAGGHPDGTQGRRAEANLPMVLLPHGGPIGVQDDWFYDDDAQFLASRGYLVLQVNYRGSSGRGEDFQEAGYLQMGHARAAGPDRRREMGDRPAVRRPGPHLRLRRQLRRLLGDDDDRSARRACSSARSATPASTTSG